MVYVLVETNHRVRILEVKELVIKLGLRNNRKVKVNIDGMDIFKGKSHGEKKQKGMV